MILVPSTVFRMTPLVATSSTHNKPESTSTWFKTATSDELGSTTMTLGNLSSEVAVGLADPTPNRN